MDDLLQVELCQDDGVTVVVVRGEIDAASAHLLQSAFENVAANDHVVLDMSEVGFIDSSGIHVVLGQAVRLLDGDGAFHIQHPSPTVQRVFDLTGLTGILMPPESR